MNRKYRVITVGFVLTSLMAALAGCAPVTSPPENKAPQAKFNLPDTKLIQGSSSEKPGAAAGKIDPVAPWPMFGGTPSRNMINLVDKNIPTTWNAEEGKFKNIKWVAQLGNRAYGGVVVADGKVFVGTNNHNPRDKKVKGQLAILLAFNEADGKFLWQIAHESPADALFNEGRSSGLCATPVVEGQRLFYVTPGCEVVCADTTGKVQWTYDM